MCPLSIDVAEFTSSLLYFAPSQLHGASQTHSLRIISSHHCCFLQITIFKVLHEARLPFYLSSAALLSIEAFVSLSSRQLLLFYPHISLKTLLDNRLPHVVGYSSSACLYSSLMSVCVVQRHKRSRAS